MGTERLPYLLQQYSGNRASKEEVEELFAFLQSDEGQDALHQAILNDQGGLGLPVSEGADWERMKKSIWSVVDADQRARVRPLKRMVGIAAAVLIVLFPGGYWAFLRPRPMKAPVVV